MYAVAYARTGTTDSRETPRKFPKIHVSTGEGTASHSSARMVNSPEEDREGDWPARPELVPEKLP